MNSNWNYSLEILSLGHNQQNSVPFDLEIWWITLKNDRAPISFHNNSWIQTGVTVWKCPIWVEINKYFLAVWTLDSRDDLDKLLGTSPKPHQALCIISSAYMNFNWSYSAEIPKLGQNLFWPLGPWLLIYGLELLHGITSVNGNSSWKFNDDVMMLI